MKYCRVQQMVKARNIMIRGKPKKDIALAFKRMMIWNYRYYNNFHEYRYGKS